MKIHIEPLIIEAVPDFKVAIIHYNRTTVSDSPQMLKGRLQLFQEQLFFELEERDLSDIQGIQEWRTIWKALGSDPTRYRPSVEALYRRVRKQNYMKSHSSAIDLNTLFSLQYGVPSGMYDLKKLVGDLTITKGQEEEDGYDGLNGRFISLHNILILKDGYSPFGSPYVDSVRTAITEETSEILHVVYLRDHMSVEEAQRLANACGNMFTSINGGEAAAHVLHADSPSLELPYSAKGESLYRSNQ
ncbi:B3/B4 domain-containing protein [Sporosarcina aquimarina]|uniref:Phenylalanine--tRNA ligase beta subunit-related protein n=1 Tax=Sporosarcina aquimarina TaxID=114975 RepID=A0ABU4G277_9BACL|nr:phenylalanine--tRNA ligase beta subunit-related protein [Sporosarcina aquimarina]MDW0111075.1 phenylalanine--tRNA ligase beta subunit-related protein [Sporosarcina aquimarina]